MVPALGVGLSSETRFGPGYTVRLRAFILPFSKASRMQECAIILRSWWASGKVGRKAEVLYGHPERARSSEVGKCLFSLLLARECSQRKERLTWSRMGFLLAHGGIGGYC